MGDEGNTMLMVAAQKGHGGLIERLLSLGMAPNRQNNDGQTALHCAAAAGQDVEVLTLLEGGADIAIEDNAGDSAIKVTKDETCEALLQSWADEYVQHTKAGGRPGAARRKSWLGVMIVPGAPPHVDLQLAADAANVEEVHKALRNDQIQLNARDFTGKTALMLAAAHPGDHGTRCVQKLLEHSVVVDAVDCGGSSALMAAADIDSEGAMMALLAAGADPMWLLPVSVWAEHPPGMPEIESEEPLCQLAVLQAVFDKIGLSEHLVALAEYFKLETSLELESAPGKLNAHSMRSKIELLLAIIHGLSGPVAE